MYMNQLPVRSKFLNGCMLQKLELHFLPTLTVTRPIHFFPTFTFRFQIGRGLIPENWNEADKTELRLNKVDKSEMS